MNSTTPCNQSLVAAGGVAPAMCWPATDGPSARNRHHLLVTAAIATTYEVKPSFTATTRRPTEGST